MDPIEILCKEYETLREEALTTMSSRNSILQFGLAAIGSIMTASVAVDAFRKSSDLSSLMLVVAVPVLVNLVLSMWLGEYERAQRAGKFLAKLEDRINQMAGETLLGWETGLRQQRKHLKYPYNTTILLLALISLVSIGMGLAASSLALPWAAAILAAGIVLQTFIYVEAVHKMEALRS